MSPSAPPAGHTAPIRFLHRGEVVSVAGEHPTRSVLDWLRESARCTGTKEGCNEGDCGACTVVLGELDADGQLQLSSVNACIQFLPTLDGKALFAVEDLPRPAADPAALHPVQQAMVECHVSQCGFCTPGFVMSLWSCYERHHQAGTQPTRQQLADELSGNLCRCTGYRPILDAGQRMFDLPVERLDSTPVVQALRQLQREGTFEYAAPGAHQPIQRFYAPTSLDELATLRAQLPGARLLAGSTDVGLWVNKQFRDLGDILYVGDVREMAQVQQQDGVLHIGAGASLEDAWTALVRQWPTLTDVWLRFASPPIRHAGTMGGNVANGSPIGDSPPVLMALDAEIELRRGTRVRRMPLADFYLDYMKNQLEPGEFVQALRVPLDAAPTRQVRAYKISKRFDCDISALCAGFTIDVRDGVVHDVRLAFGGMAATVRRAAQAEAALRGQPWTQATVQAAQQALAQDFTPLSDMRASAAYRLQVAQNLLQRLWLETRSDGALPPEATSVWSVMPHGAAQGA